jgi:hypothetical protein
LAALAATLRLYRDARCENESALAERFAMRRFAGQQMEG